MASTRFQKTPLHYIQYLGLKGLCALVRLLPYKMAVRGMGKLMGLSRFLLPKRFKLVCHNIALAFPQKSPEEVFQIALKSWQNMGTILAEFVQLANMSKEEFKKHCQIEGLEKIQKAQGTTGGIIHIGHFTNWEAFGLAASVYGMEKAVLAQRVDNPYVDEEMNRLRNIFSGHTFSDSAPFRQQAHFHRRKKQLIMSLFQLNFESAAGHEPATILSYLRIILIRFYVSYTSYKSWCTQFVPIMLIS